MNLTLDQVHELATRAHEGQTDKIGTPYICHVEAVAAGLAPFGEYMQMAGLLHDVIEDTSWTGDALIEAGVPWPVVDIVKDVTNVPGVSYMDKIWHIANRRPGSILVKIADNAHNSRRDRVGGLDRNSRERLAKKYREAREILWGAVPAADVRKVLSIVNPELLDQLKEPPAA